MKNNLYLFRMKAIFSDRLTWIIMIVSSLIFLFIINNLSMSAGERSSIPIGVLNLDRSETADELIESIKEIPALYVYEGSEKELKQLLYKEEIRAYFIIKEGYEKSIQAGNTDGLITMHYQEADESAKILSDIIAGDMLYKICLFKGYNLYHSLPEKGVNRSDSSADTKINNRLTEEEYMTHAKALEAMPDFDFAFDIRMIDVMNKNNEGKIENSILYLQAIWGIVAMLLSFTAMLMTAGSVMEKEMGILSRVKLSLMKSYTMDLSHFGAALTVQSIISFFLCFLLKGKIGNLSLNQVVLLFLSLEMFSALMIVWFLFLGKLSGRTGRYQLFGVISILVFGIMGFLYLMSGFIDDKLLNITKIIPNCWFIEEFTDIILNKNLQDVPFISCLEFIMTACGLLALNGLISKRQYR
jgi:ABC-2 type transport system permease protein